MSIGARINVDQAMRSAAANLGVRLKVTESFFDRPAVQRAMDKATHEALSKAARFIRTRAKTSMRYVTTLKAQQRQIAEGTRKKAAVAYTHSRPGEPPRAVRPHPWVRDHLYYHYDRRRQQAVVGPAGFARGTDAPHTLEFGGDVVIRKPRRVRRRLGDGGEVRLGGPQGRTAKPAIDRHGVSLLVTYAKLKTQRQVDRANAINEQLYGQAVRHKSLAARPYMGPALQAETPQLPMMWHNRLRG